VNADSKQDAQSSGSELQVLDVNGVREQMGFDRDLMVEIIDLFLSEAPQQVIDMREAMAAGELERVGRLAHTIKGSFSTLHAGVARTHAQELEIAAKQRESVRCRELVSALEYDLEVLEPRLLSLRNSSQSA
jgi:HPt (histidine-containing phosphotransfer) domain-containing protein